MAQALRDLAKQGEVVHERSAKYDPKVALPPSVGRNKARARHRKLQLNLGWPKPCNCEKCGDELRWPSHYGAEFVTRDWVRGLRCVVAAGWMCFECWLEKNAPNALTDRDNYIPEGETRRPTAREARRAGLTEIRRR